MGLAQASAASAVRVAAACGWPMRWRAAWGQAFVALGQPEPARRAFTQALAVRQRIGHPQAAATHTALAALA